MAAKLNRCVGQFRPRARVLGIGDGGSRGRTLGGHFPQRPTSPAPKKILAPNIDDASNSRVRWFINVQCYRQIFDW